MKDAFLVPLQVFGIGFVISMCMAGLIKLLMNVIRRFSKSTDEVHE